MEDRKEVQNKLKETAIMLGIGAKHMTIYRAELINLKNDGLKVREISNLLEESEAKINNWYNKEVQPKDIIIEKLEKLYFIREDKIRNRLRSPKIK